MKIHKWNKYLKLNESIRLTIRKISLQNRSFPFVSFNSISSHLVQLNKYLSCIFQETTIGQLSNLIVIANAQSTLILYPRVSRNSFFNIHHHQQPNWSKWSVKILCLLQLLAVVLYSIFTIFSAQLAKKIQLPSPHWLLIRFWVTKIETRKRRSWSILLLLRDDDAGDLLIDLHSRFVPLLIHSFTNSPHQFPKHKTIPRLFLNCLFPSSRD